MAGSDFEPVGSAGQQRVDTIQRAIRLGVAPLDDAGPGARLLPPDLTHRVAAELSALKLLVETLGSDLVADPVVITNHAAALQGLDRVSQSLGSLADLVTSDHLPDALAAISMSDLRARLADHS